MALWLAAILAWLPAPLLAVETALPHADDLHAAAAQMRRQHRPMVVLFSQADCPWCEQVRRYYLAPMSREAPWRERALYRQIDMDSDAPLTDFAGQPTTNRAFARHERVRMTPTVVVYGPDGERLADPIIGMRLPDFYGQYIEQAIDNAAERMAPSY